ncbi:Sodium/hydrogen exchanger 7 [Arachnomyces sp. PD_36]|nr:Sodium/hydrogen exchanger 7 [Arachnomyces sp. PD_36]
MASLVGNEIFSQILRRATDDDADPDEPADPDQKEFFSSWALFILIALLISALFTSYILQQKKIQAVHETGLSIFAGMVVGLIIRLMPGRSIQDSVTFDYQFFFNLLLPPIILASGYELHQANFFRNIGTILTFAFLGTFISAVVLGLILWLWTRLPIDSLHISFVEALSVGATLSATDPVTILAIFNMYKVEPKLYTVIFGESILNDAVAIVLFETAQRYKPGSQSGPLTALSVFEAIGIFLLVFFGSLIIGVVVGIGTALALKYTHVRRQPKIESCLIILIAYASYFFSNGVYMSGIVSLLFCGITLKHYAYYNMSRRTQLTTKYLFQVLAQLSENFIFIYLGLDLFTETDLKFNPLFILVAVIGICVARYMSVFPLSKAINWFIRYRAKRHGKEVADELPFNYQAMLFWAGLRGAVGVALAAGLGGNNGPELRAAVLVVVVLTVIIFGGTTARMLEILGIRTGVVEDVESDDEFDIEPTNGTAYYKRPLGHLQRRSDLGISLEDIDNANRRAAPARSYSSGNNRYSPTSQPGSGSMGVSARKKSAAAQNQPLLGDIQGGESAGGSITGSGDDEQRRGRARGGRTEPDADVDDFDLDLGDLTDDDDDGLPPPSAASASVSRTRQQFRTPSQNHASPSRIQPPGSSSGAAVATAGGEQSHPTITPGGAFRELLSGNADGDRAAWFKQLDEDYIKPKLLLDQGSGHKGPGAV